MQKNYTILISFEFCKLFMNFLRTVKTPPETIVILTVGWLKGPKWVNMATYKKTTYKYVKRIQRKQCLRSTHGFQNAK